MLDCLCLSVWFGDRVTLPWLYMAPSATVCVNAVINAMSGSLHFWAYSGLCACNVWNGNCVLMSLCVRYVCPHGGMIVYGYWPVCVTCVFAWRETVCFSVVLWDGTAEYRMLGDSIMTVIDGRVMWTLMLCDFAFMTTSEMCMAVNLNNRLSSCVWVWPSLEIVVSGWLYACLGCACLFPYNACAIDISVSVCLSI